MNNLIYRLKFKAYVLIRERVLNKVFADNRNKRINSQKFTIISNNCWGGHVYRFFNLTYDSPTIGMYFFSEEYIKFLSNLRYYLDCPLKVVNASKSKYFKYLKLRNEQDVLIGILDDVEIVLLHYHTPEEAVEKWNRRRQRIHLDHLIVKFSEQNLCTSEILKQFDLLPFNTKFVFTHKDYGLKSQVIYGGYENEDEVKSDILYFRKYVNLFNLVNGMPFKQNQPTL